VGDGAVTLASLYRPDNSTTGAPVQLTPNSTPNDHYPSINFKVLAPNLSVHGDGVNRGQSEVFPVIERNLFQLAGLLSIYSTQRC
jgi:multidrug efflux pump subunit AcrB